MGAHHAVGVLPHLGHRVDVARLERLVKRGVHRSNLVLRVDGRTVAGRVHGTVTPPGQDGGMSLEAPRTLSPSKVAAFTDCALAFRFATIDRLPRPPPP